MVANKYAFLQITRRRFLNEWEAFKKVISRRNIRRRITIPLTLSNLKLLRRITRTENILHRNFTRRQVAIQNRVASNIGISQSTFSVKVLVTQFCRKLAAERPLKDIRDEYNYPKKKGIKDECSRLLEASTMKSRRGFAIQRLMNAMRQAHADGWFIVFDTLTLAD